MCHSEGDRIQKCEGIVTFRNFWLWLIISYFWSLFRLLVSHLCLFFSVINIDVVLFPVCFMPCVDYFPFVPWAIAGSGLLFTNWRFDKAIRKLQCRKGKKKNLIKHHFSFFLTSTIRKTLYHLTLFLSLVSYYISRVHCASD